MSDPQIFGQTIGQNETEKKTGKILSLFYNLACSLFSFCYVSVISIKLFKLLEIKKDMWKISGFGSF